MFDFPVIQTGLISFVVLMCLVAWILVLNRYKAGKPVWAVQPQEEACWGLVDLLMFFAFMMVSQGVISLLLITNLNIDTTVASSEWTSTQRRAVAIGMPLSQVATCLFSLGWLHYRYGAHLSVLAIAPDKLKADLLLGLLASVMLIPPVLALHALLALWIPYDHSTLQLVREQPSLTTVLIGCFGAMAVAPIVEEYQFRVFLQGWLQRLKKRPAKELPLVWYGGRQRPEAGARDDSTSAPNQNQAIETSEAAVDFTHAEPDHPRAEQSVPIWPVFVSSALFALVHAGQGPAPISLFVFAIGLGILYRMTHRVVPCVVVHLVLNTWSLAVSFHDTFTK